LAHSFQIVIRHVYVNQFDPAGRAFRPPFGLGRERYGLLNRLRHAFPPFKDIGSGEDARLKV
jgi:hypothetical protein